MNALSQAAREKAQAGPRARLHVFTCSVYPDLTRVWYHVLSRTFDGSPPPTLIFDCGGGLVRERLGGACVKGMPNWEHGRKIDLALHELEAAEFVLVLDDDVFLLSEAALRRGLAALESDGKMAAYTFHCRDWWKLPAAAELHVPMGSYALLVKPALIRGEGLSFRTRRSDDAAVRNGSGYWDTADYCQKELLERGYTIGYAPEGDRLDVPTFFGTSGGFLTFARRALLSRRYVRRWRRGRSEEAVLADVYSYQRGCAMAAVIDAFRSLLPGQPSFSDWFSEDELRSLAWALPDAERRRAYAVAADRVFRVRDRLLAA